MCRMTLIISFFTSSADQNMVSVQFLLPMSRTYFITALISCSLTFDEMVSIMFQGLQTCLVSLLYRYMMSSISVSKDLT